MIDSEAHVLLKQWSTGTGYASVPSTRTVLVVFHFC